jgi:ABC-2 type transport system ATP-binding protein
VSVSVAGGGRELLTVLRLVEDAGVEVEDVALRQPRLDEAFLALTDRLHAGSTPDSLAS